MTRYVIDPAGVQAVLVATLTPANALGTALAPLAGAMKQAGEGSDGSPEIVSALDRLMGSENTRIGGMIGRVDACLTGAAQATSAYVHADKQMSDTARAAQAHAVALANALPR